MSMEKIFVADSYKDMQIVSEPFENEKGQYFYVNAVLYLSTRKAGISDRLDDSVSYADVCMLIIKEMTEHTYKLIEAAAEHTALKILEQYELLRGISLEIRKPDAPVDAEFSSVYRRLFPGYIRR